MNQQLVDSISDKIIEQLNKRSLGVLKNSTELMNYINYVALGQDQIEDFNMDYPEEYNAIYQKIKMFLKNKKAGMSENKKTNLKEAPTQSIPTTKVLLNYKDDDVVTILKKTFEKFDDFDIEKIQSNGDKYYNLIVIYHIEEMPEHFELMKYTYVQKIHAFRIDLFTELSKVLPVVNTTIGSFEFIKNTEQFKFALTILLSDTNIHDWVTGETKTIDGKERKKIIDSVKESVQKKTLKEAVDASQLEKGKGYYYEKPFAKRQLLTYMGGGYVENYGYEFATRNITDGNGQIITYYLEDDSLQYLTPRDQINPNEIQEEQKPVEIKPTLPHHDLFGESKNNKNKMIKESINQPDYQFYVCEIINGTAKINEGFSSKEDADYRIKEQKAEGNTEGLTFKTLSGKFLKSKGIDPNNDKSWGNPSYIRESKLNKIKKLVLEVEKLTGKKVRFK